MRAPDSVPLADQAGEASGFGREYAMLDGRVYGSVNGNILELLGPARRVLDIGCGDGSLGPALRQAGAVELVGIEPVHEAAVIASRTFDRVVEGLVEDIELDVLGTAQFDAIIAADVLEHLVDPWTQLEKWRDWVKPNGVIAISVPNLRHLRVLATLVGRGRFDYDPVGGVMDSTHLRWFTKRSLTDQLQHAGWEPLRWARAHGRRSGPVDRLTGGICSDLLVRQLTVVATPAPPRR